MSPSAPPLPLLLFDGVCNLCDASVNFIIDRDPQGALHFASLQSATGQRLLLEHGRGGELPDSLVLLDAEGVWVESDAALRVAKLLTGPWKAVCVARVLPKRLRDVLYRLIARNRYRLFGRRDACRIPTPELRARFLDL